MTGTVSLKAGIYYSHYECFGHTSRVIAIAQVFKKKFPQGGFFFVQAGLEQPLAQFKEYGRTYALPAPYVDRGIFRGSSPSLGTSASQRAKACLDVIDRESPDLFITEFFPMGREESRYELMPTLVKSVLRGTALWAVAGYPLLVGAGHGWRDKIVKMYQKIIIFAPFMEKELIAASLPEGKTKERYNDFFKINEAKIIFAGYLLPEGNIINGARSEEGRIIPVASKGSCKVVVVRGGGAVYPKVIAEAIRSGDILGGSYYITAVAGPSTTQEEWRFFCSLLAKNKVKNVVLERTVDDYEGLIKNSDVCVATSSYHTAVMLMKHKKKAVIVPFEGYGKEMVYSEQPARAAMLKNILGASVLRIQELSAKSLSDSIIKANKDHSQTIDIPKSWFSGAGSLNRALSESYG